jgi:hypothetical protein
VRPDNPFRRVARHTPAPLDGLLEYAAGALNDGRLPLPAKIKVQVLPPIDLRERYGDDPDTDTAYEEVTAEMQDALSALDEERSLPVVG